MAESQILSGKTVSQHVYSQLDPRIKTLINKNIIPGLAVIIVGENPASRVYVNSKTKRFKDLGLFSKTYNFHESSKEDELIRQIKSLNNDQRFHGILVQMPLPKHINEEKIIRHIDPTKDVDGFHPENGGLLSTGNPRFIPCTPKGIMRILKYYEINLSGKHVVIIGRSNIVGRPISILTSLKSSFSNATTTICHSGTADLKQYTLQADILIAAMGSPHYISADYVKADAIVIDVGINRVEDDSEKGYSLVGDVDYESVTGNVSAITPVPGGVGPLTIAMLVENTIEAAESTLI